MDSKHLLHRYLTFLGIFLLASGIFLPAYYNLSYPAPLGPRFEAGVKQEHKIWIERNEPDVVLIGDSVLYEGVDPLLLSEQLGAESYAIPVPGSGTASWYLLLKNVILESSHKPKYVVVLFRNTMLTVPQYRTTGRYFPLLDDFASRNEPLVSQMVFVNQMSAPERFAAQFIPLYTARLELREGLDNLLRYRLPFALTGCNRLCIDESVESMFGREVNLSALNQLMEDAAQTLYDSKEMDFERQVDDSFLPHMIELTARNHITLIFVRTKIFGEEPPALNDYNMALETYLAEYDHVILKDYSRDPRITQAFYVDSLHMNPYGKREFTRMLADELSSIIRQ